MDSKNTPTTSENNFWLSQFGLYKYESSKSRSSFRIIVAVTISTIVLISVAFGVLYATRTNIDEIPVTYTTVSSIMNSIESKINLERPLESTTIEMITEENYSSDASAEKLILFKSTVPKTYLAPPPLIPYDLPKLSVNKGQIQRREFEEERFPRPFYPPLRKSRPVNSIQDILNQMEIDSGAITKRPRRINFYGRFRHQRPNRPKPIPIHDNFKPSVASDVNLLANNQMKMNAISGAPSQLYYPNNINPTMYNNNNGGEASGGLLYDQIVATNKKRQQITKNSKPFSLMLDIYPMNGENEDPNKAKVNFNNNQQLNSQYLDSSSYYNSVNFPQINQHYYQTSTQPPYTNPQHFPGSNTHPVEKPSKMVVHLNLYPTKKANQESKNSELSHKAYPKFDHKVADEDFVPIPNPQIYYHSKSSDDIDNHYVLKNLSESENIVEIPKRNNSSQFRIIIPQQTLTTTPPILSEIEIFQSVELGPAINITDFETTIPPDVINKAIYHPYYSSSFLDNPINEISKRQDNDMEPPVIQHNSHQPDNPMIIASYLKATTTIQPVFIDDSVKNATESLERNVSSGH